MSNCARRSFVCFLFLSAAVFSSCQGHSVDPAALEAGANGQESAAWWVSPTPAPTGGTTPTTTKIALIYSGPGATASDVVSIGEILKKNGLRYVTANHTTLNSMSLATLVRYSILIFPGGDSNDMHAALTASTRLRVKKAIIQYGVSYTGFCAGAWMAVGPAQAVSATPWWGFGFVPGAYLKQYYPNRTNPESAMIKTRFATGETRDLVWWRGPVLPEISGGVVARYPDGSPAFIGTYAGKGYVTLTGPHPEAPQSWRYGLWDSDGLDYDVAWRVIQAALKKLPLAAY